MEGIDLRKAMISGGLTAGMGWMENRSSGMGGASPSLMKGVFRGAAVSVGADIVSEFMGQNTEENLIVSSLIAGGLNAGYGRWSAGDSSLTKDFFMGALVNAGAGYVADALESRGGIQGMISNGVTIV